jgi:hypothetical protein
MAKGKKSPTKKATYKIPSFKRKPIASGIGLISSINCTRPLKEAFEAGSGITPTYKCNKGYRGLSRAVDEFNGDGGVGLIVTVGGLIAYKAANSRSTKPFVSLAGMIPSNPGGLFKGLVNLQMYTFNPDRISYLGTKGFQSNHVYLFYNPNSATAQDETCGNQRRSFFLRYQGQTYPRGESVGRGGWNQPIRVLSLAELQEWRTRPHQWESHIVRSNARAGIWIPWPAGGKRASQSHGPCDHRTGSTRRP